MNQDSQEHIVKIRNVFIFEIDCQECEKPRVIVKFNVFEGISRYCPNCKGLWNPAFSDEEKFKKWHGEMLRTLQKRLAEEGPYSFSWGFGDFE